LEFIYWVLVATIPFFLFHLTQRPYDPDCLISLGCILLDERSLMLRPLFVYSCILLIPLSLVKMGKKIRSFFIKK
jgi:hypothetical protein